MRWRGWCRSSTARRKRTPGRAPRRGLRAVRGGTARALGVLCRRFPFRGGSGLGHALVGSRDAPEAAKLVLEANQTYPKGTVLACELEAVLVALYQPRNERGDLMSDLGTVRALRDDRPRAPCRGTAETVPIGHQDFDPAGRLLSR